MGSWLNILAIGIWLGAWPCYGKVYEVGLEVKYIKVDEVKYYIEPAAVPLDVEKFKDFTVWKVDKERRFLSHTDVNGQRVVISFDLSTNITMPIYLQYFSISPLKYQKFVVIDSSGNVIDTDVVQRNMLLASAYLVAGQYKVLFIAEPRQYSTVDLDAFYIENFVYISSTYVRDARLNLLIYGIGLAFIFFNFSMFLLHRKPYFIYYVGYSLTILFPLVVGSGDLPLPSIIIWNMSMFFNCLFTVLMSASILSLREFYPRILRFALILCGVAFLILVLHFLTDNFGLLILFYTFGIACYSLCVFASVRRMQAGYIPATFLALGWGVLVLGYAVTMMSMYFINIPGLGWAGYIAFALESMLFAVALAYRTRDSEQRAVQDKVHALAQLQKVVYPHQLRQITSGGELESSMPTTSGHACVISFDIIGSSKIKHIKAKEFFRNVFTRCNAIMAEGYDGVHLKANAYRIKEMGDGFLCSVGYPFQAMSDNPANAAIDLAWRFAQVLAEEAPMLHSKTPIACGIGIALDTLTGFYPEAGTKEYDIFGPALILATRYEGMRKIISPEGVRSILIIQSAVYDSLDPIHREGFIELNLNQQGIVVRDDPAAATICYQFLDQQEAPTGKPETQLKAV